MQIQKVSLHKYWKTLFETNLSYSRPTIFSRNDTIPVIELSVYCYSLLSSTDLRSARFSCSFWQFISLVVVVFIKHNKM